MWSYRVLEGTLRLPNFNEAFGETALMYREVEVLCFQYKKKEKRQTNSEIRTQCGRAATQSVCVQLLKDA